MPGRQEICERTEGTKVLGDLEEEEEKKPVNERLGKKRYPSTFLKPMPRMGL